VHGADEELTVARPRSELLARLPVLRADLASLLGEDDPRRRDVLRLLDRLADETDEVFRLAATEDVGPSPRGYESGGPEPPPTVT
jgi:hypothetical protein